MLLNAVLAAALLLAAAACPCPPAPAAAEVCGSDLVTYPSQCHLLQCVAVPGLSLKHLGPCSPEDTVSADQLAGGRANQRRTANDTLRKWDSCSEHERQCHRVSCSECGPDDYWCAVMCEWNCDCGCAGFPPARGGLNIGQWKKCYEMRCPGGCKTFCERERGGWSQCRGACELDLRRCRCECLQAHNQNTTTTNTGATQDALDDY
ncbi:agrin-like isoform X1 [Frankliniella occidentalis]|uniref:Agrin-like isoform X1 n=1 Tax=Frankliniella occidentalis TaxID=133901 RepID=A0A6J1SG16_FRAOC|nr:agrin-like isoform X1 [Frankliniella occidentalis]